MPIGPLDAATCRHIARLLAAETDDFNALVRLSGLDPARDFRHTDLAGTDMAGADLRGFDFSYSDFRRVNVAGALIAGARFEGADLGGTDLSRARGADRADLRFATFQHAPFAPEMVMLPAGTFLMGSPAGEPGRSDDEGPQREVSVDAFAIGRYPVTFAEYDHYCAAMSLEPPSDEGWGRDRRPVINVDWQDAKVYVSWLAESTGRNYRLPSEAEWEYAARAGTQTAYWWGDDFDPAVANTGESRAGRTSEVGSFPANPWGLHDTAGNVWEWVEDPWHGSHEGRPSDGRVWADDGGQDRPRVLRGGSWYSFRDGARCAFRDRDSPYYRYDGVGFRVVCSSPS